jgi:hydroxymethylbilane synthase
MRLIIGTRGSQLALRQAELVQRALQTHRSSITAELLIIRTQGDERLDLRLTDSGKKFAKGLFTKELEEALLNGTISLAVHSLKDLPDSRPAGLKVGAVLARADPRDVVVLSTAKSFDDVPIGALLATSSPRRIRQLQQKRPDIRTEEIRGNVPTRLRKLAERPELAGIVLAKAGLDRLGLLGSTAPLHFENRSFTVEALDWMVPAAGQGAIAMEILEKNDELDLLLQSVNHLPTWRTVAVEREVLRRLGGGCEIPIAVGCNLVGDELFVRAVVFDASGRARTATWNGLYSSSEEGINQLLKQLNER